MVEKHFGDDDISDLVALGMMGMVYNVIIITDSDFLEKVFTDFVSTRRKEYRDATIDTEKYGILGGP
jgi:hypothetical protein